MARLRLVGPDRARHLLRQLLPPGPGRRRAARDRPEELNARVRLHDLRHSFAVLSLSAEAHCMQVSQWLGHESYVTT
jgi:integrase